jgi:hypothetical protein
MAIGCIDPSNLLEDGAVFILGDFVEALPDEVPIHSSRFQIRYQLLP